MSEGLKELVRLFGESQPVVSVCGDNLSEVLAEAKRQEEEFWAWVSEERARLEALEKAREEVPDLLTWLEKEIQEAREAAFSAMARRENGVEYWTGYADALEALLNAIRRRKVRG